MRVIVNYIPAPRTLYPIADGETRPTDCPHIEIYTISHIGNDGELLDYKVRSIPLFDAENGEYRGYRVTISLIEFRNVTELVITDNGGVPDDIEPHHIVSPQRDIIGAIEATNNAVLMFAQRALRAKLNGVHDND
jgi:hypothetical protein